MLQSVLFASKPVRIEAVQWNGEAKTAGDIIDWISENGGTARYYEVNETHDRKSAEIHILTLEGVMALTPENWVIRGTVGEFYPVRDDVFRGKYEGDFDAGRIK